MKHLFLILLLVHPSYAQVTFLEKGTPAPHEGYLFTKEAEHKARLSNEELKYVSRVLEFQKNLEEVQTKRLENMTERMLVRDQQIESMAKTISETRETPWFSYIGFFLLGSLVTTGIVYGVSRTIK